MRRKVPLVLLLLLCNISLFSQSDFRKGYIVTNSNDTIHGFINYRGDIKNCAECVFKEDNLGTEKIYNPGEIRAYRFDKSKYYISYYLQDIEKEVFLEFLMDGIVNLYYYKDLLRESYFISKHDSELHKLDNEIKEVVINGVRYEKESKRYLRVLRYLFSDSDIDMNKINNVRLNHKHLISIADEYHKSVCNNNECIIFEKKIPAVRFEFEGLIFSEMINLEVDGINQYTELNYNTSWGYCAGLGLSMFMPRLNEKVSVYSQILYSNNKFSSSYITENIFGSYVTNYDINMEYVNTSIGFKYNFPEQKISPSFFILASYFMVLNDVANRDITEEDLNGVISNYSYTDKVLTSSFGFTVGADLKIFDFKKVDLGISVQYTYTSGRDIYGSYDNPGKYAANYSDFANNVNSLRLGLFIKY
jgi:hypothetical protein